MRPCPPPPLLARPPPRTPRSPTPHPPHTGRELNVVTCTSRGAAGTPLCIATTHLEPQAAMGHRTLQMKEAWAILHHGRRRDASAANTVLAGVRRACVCVWCRAKRIRGLWTKPSI